jgi:hypothetical protein
MDRDELLRLYDAGDTHGLLCAAMRLHADGKFGEAWSGGLACFSLGAGREHEQIIVPRGRPSAPSPSLPE